MLLFERGHQWFKRFYFRVSFRIILDTFLWIISSATAEQKRKKFMLSIIRLLFFNNTYLHKVFFYLESSFPSQFSIFGDLMPYSIHQSIYPPSHPVIHPFIHLFFENYLGIGHWFALKISKLNNVQSFYLRNLWWEKCET